MNLPDADRKLFLKLYHSLFIYVNKKHKILKNLNHPRDLFGKNLEDIEKLKDKPELLPVYSEEMGRVQARNYRKRLKDIGIKEGWFAIIEGIIIAGGQDKKNVEKAAESLLPEEKRNLVHIFHLKGK